MRTTRRWRKFNRHLLVALAWVLILATAVAGCRATAGGEQTQPGQLVATSTAGAPVEEAATAQPATPERLATQPAEAGSQPEATQITDSLAGTGSNPTQAVPTGEAAIDCTSPAAPTPAMTEGPYYTPNTPERTSLLEPGVAGEPLVLTGYVLTTECQPVPGAWLDFWQTDGNGVYDNRGYRLRGHQFTDSQGRYYLETVIPGLYPGRTAHIHVKVQAPGGEVLTTQLFIPGEPGNDSDRIFSPQLVMEYVQQGEAATQASATQAKFNFILETR